MRTSDIKNGNIPVLISFDLVSQINKKPHSDVGLFFMKILKSNLRKL